MDKEDEKVDEQGIERNAILAIDAATRVMSGLSTLYIIERVAGTKDDTTWAGRKLAEIHEIEEEVSKAYSDVRNHYVSVVKAIGATAQDGLAYKAATFAFEEASAGRTAVSKRVIELKCRLEDIEDAFT